MPNDLKQFSQSIKDASPRTRMVAIGGVVLVLLLLAAAWMYSSRPHFVLLHAQVDDQERVAVEKALAAGKIRYRISQPPGPFVIDVDEGQFYEAQNAVAVAGAMQRANSGIDTDSQGASTVFMTSAERAQTMLKREWQELESQLGCLDFVASARVTTAIPDNSPLRARKPVTVSVTLSLRGQSDLTAEQAENVARIVRYRFDVPAENVIITDQNARTLYAGELAGDSNLAQNQSRSEHARNFERTLETKANAALSRAFGEHKGYITLASEWDFDLRTTDDETLQPKGVLVDDEKTETITPPGAASNEVGGVAGVASNISTDPNGAAPAAAGLAAAAPATSVDQTRRYETGRTRTRTVHSTPTLKRLSVSLVLDESLAARKDEIAQFVEAMVGFESGRSDVMRVSTTAIAVPTPEVAGEPGQPPAAEGLSPTAKLLMRHGVELLAAIAFLFVALKALKGARGSSRSPSLGGAAAGVAGSGAARGLHLGVEPDELEPAPELLARVRDAEHVRSAPRRVGEILSRWATESTQKSGASR
jgi:flagellar biosynthesis/type III secretory pathway M-ring protein FliF/YscJ